MGVTDSLAAHDPDPPLVSVIIPAYNSARTIERCVAALARQDTRRRYEVLVVHSGDDDTCARASAILPAVRTVQLTDRAIPPRARHIGVQHARGSILAFIDSDIYVLPDWVDHVVRVAERGYDVACGSIENANPHSRTARAEQLLMFNEFMPDQPEHPSWFALSGNTVLTRHAYEQFGPFAEIRAAEDIVFSRHLIARGGRILFDPSLRARHDNRTRLMPFLRNQLLVGRHTAIARRLVRFADSSSHLLFLMALPIAPIVKLAKVARHLGRYDRRRALMVIREFPILSIGVLAYCLGLALGATGWTDRTIGGVRPESPNAKEPRSGAARADVGNGTR